MDERIWGHLIEHWETFEEKVFTKKIILDDKEIYPLNKISILLKKTGNIATLSITPLAWIVVENKFESDDMGLESQYSMILFDENNLELVEDIVKQFKSEIIGNE